MSSQRGIDEVDRVAVLTKIYCDIFESCRHFIAMLLLIRLACLAGTLTNVYDVVMPNYRSSCSNGCLDWSSAATSLPPAAKLSQPDIDQMFSAKNGSAAAKDRCAMPGARAGTHEKDCGLHCYPGTDQWSYIYDSYAGPWCFCKDPVRAPYAVL